MVNPVPPGSLGEGEAMHVMVSLGFTIAYLLLVAVTGVRAEHRLRHRARLPMQWGLNGRPTWTAPRRLALTLVPMLAGSPLFVTTALLIVSPDRANLPDEAMPIVQGVMALVGLAIHAGYLWGLGRWDALSRD